MELINLNPPPPPLPAQLMYPNFVVVSFIIRNDRKKQQQILRGFLGFG